MAGVLTQRLAYRSYIERVITIGTDGAGRYGVKLNSPGGTGDFGDLESPTTWLGGSIIGELSWTFSGSNVNTVRFNSSGLNITTYQRLLLRDSSAREIYLDGGNAILSGGNQADWSGLSSAFTNVNLQQVAIMAYGSSRV